MLLSELVEEVEFSFVPADKNATEDHKFYYVKQDEGGKEPQITFEGKFIEIKAGFRDDQDIVVLEVDNETSNRLQDVADCFTREDNETQTYDMVFRDEIKIKLLRDEKGGYKTRTNLTPDTVATLGYGSLLAVTGTLGWYCVPSKGQGLFLKVRDCRPVVAGGKKKVLKRK